MYGVFGVAPTLAKKRVLKDMKACDENGRPYTLQEFADQLHDKAKETMETMKPSLISPEYANISEAKAFKLLAAKSGCISLAVKRKANIPGAQDKRGRPLFNWEPAA